MRQLMLGIVEGMKNIGSMDRHDKQGGYYYWLAEIRS
jgi:hypothetical protein